MSVVLCARCQRPLSMSGNADAVLALGIARAVCAPSCDDQRRVELLTTPEATP